MKKVILIFMMLFTIITFIPQTASAYGPEKLSGNVKDTDVTVDVDGGKITLGIGDHDATDPEEAYKNLTKNYKNVAVGITGVCAITSLLFFLFNITKLGGAGDNERERSLAIRGILFSGLALVLFGGSTVVVGLFWNAFQPS